MSYYCELCNYHWYDEDRLKTYCSRCGAKGIEAAVEDD